MISVVQVERLIPSSLRPSFFVLSPHKRCSIPKTFPAMLSSIFIFRPTHGEGNQTNPSVSFVPSFCTIAVCVTCCFVGKKKGYNMQSMQGYDITRRFESIRTTAEHFTLSTLLGTPLPGGAFGGNRRALGAALRLPPAVLLSSAIRLHLDSTSTTKRGMSCGSERVRLQIVSTHRSTADRSPTTRNSSMVDTCLPHLHTNI